MRSHVSPHEFVAGKIDDVVHVIDGIIFFGSLATPKSRIAIPSSTTRPSLILLLLRQPTSFSA